MGIYPLLSFFQRGIPTTAVGSRLSVTCSSIPFPASPAPAVQHVQSGGLHIWSLVRVSVYPPCARSFIRNTVRYRIDAVQCDIVRIAQNEVNGVSHLGSGGSPQFPRSSTLQDRRCTMRYTISRNDTRITDTTGPPTWAIRSLHRRTTLIRSTALCKSPICFPGERFQRCSTLSGPKYGFYAPFTNLSYLIDSVAGSLL
jgi:hypothetical protein